MDSSLKHRFLPQPSLVRFLHLIETSYRRSVSCMYLDPIDPIFNISNLRYIEYTDVFPMFTIYTRFTRNICSSHRSFEHGFNLFLRTPFLHEKDPKPRLRPRNTPKPSLSRAVCLLQDEKTMGILTTLLK